MSAERDRNAAATPEEARAEAERELRAAQHRILVGGRWLLFAAEIVVAALHRRVVAGSWPVELLFAFLILYDAAALIALYVLPEGRIRPSWLLAIDAFAIGWLAAVTNGIASPFGGLFYLISLLGAVFYEFPGSLAIALCGSALMLLGPWVSPLPANEAVWNHQRTQLIPFLLLHSVIAAYLVRQLKVLHRRRIEVAEQLERARYEMQLRQQEDALAREIQRATLPEPLPHALCDFAVRFEPARDVGGDFYSFLEEGAQLGVIIGDVSGKGIPAALVSTSICHLSHCLPAMEDPARFLRDVNRDLLERLPEWAFATLSFAIVDPERGQLTIYNAGHPPPLVISGGVVRPAGTPNVPLGAVDDPCFPPAAIPFSDGDTLVLYTDGFIEARDDQGEQLGLDGFAALLAEHALLPLDQIASRVLECVRASWRVRDDLTLVIVRATSTACLVPVQHAERELTAR